MKASMSGDELWSELVKLWGLKHCKNIKINIPNNGLVELVITFNATNEQGKQFIDIIKKYKLESMEEAAG